MRPCDKCLENNWKFKVEDGWCFATCICGHEVEWQLKEKRELQVGAISLYQERLKQYKRFFGKMTHQDDTVTNEKVEMIDSSSLRRINT